MEEWDLYDVNRNITGKTHIRGNEIPDDLYHLVVHIWIKNSKGEYLISQRSENKSYYPLMWECVGGSVLKNEDSIHGAIRETKEEVGIDLNNVDGKLIYSKVRRIVNGHKSNSIMDVWLFNYDGEVNLNNATTDEVRDVKWMTKEQVIQLFYDKKMVQTLDYFMNEIDI